MRLCWIDDLSLSLLDLRCPARRWFENLRKVAGHIKQTFSHIATLRACGTRPLNLWHCAMVCRSSTGKAIDGQLIGHKLSRTNNAKVARETLVDTTISFLRSE